MSVPWKSSVKSTGKLRVFNSAGAWSADVDKAVAKFKTLGFPVELVPESNEKSANVVVRLASGPDSYQFDSPDFDSIKLKTAADFRPDAPHGSTVPVFPEQYGEILFAVIFLPGMLTQPSAGLKEVVIIHELIHAAGMVSKEKDKQKNKKESHDNDGIMYDIMTTAGGGLIEGTMPKGKKPMPPIRIGSKTRSEIKSAWNMD